MTTPTPSRQAAPTSRSGVSMTKPTNLRPEWRCTSCDKLLGVSRDGRMHLRFARGHEYLVGYPIQATCRGCGTLNQATTPTR